METRLMRSSRDKMLSGVCGGLGDYFGIDSTLVRVFFVLGVLFGIGFTIPIYLLLWIVMPMDKDMPAPSSSAPPALPTAQQDPTGEWRYDPYSGEPIRRDEPTN